MRNSKWLILGVLFFARAGMGFQYQTIGSSALQLRTDYGLSLGQIGVLIGIYFLLGIGLALPGGALGARIGSKTSVLLGLLLMSAGGVIAAFDTSWPLQLGARTLAGAGGVMLNVMMSKMVTDWFEPKELPTAMGIFVSSWTFGVAVGLVSIPSLLSAHDAYGVFLASSIWAICGFLAVAAIYRSPQEGESTTSFFASAWPTGMPLVLVVLAGSMWGWFNAGFAMIFSYGPSALAESGMSVATAGLIISIVLWASMISVPLGGYVADKTKRGELLIVLCPALAGLLIATSPYLPAAALVFVILGLIVGLPAGSIMALPAKVLRPEHRAIGMGVFFTVFYALMVAAPIVAGAFAEYVGNIKIAYQSGALCMLLGLMSYAAHVFLARRTTGG